MVRDNIEKTLNELLKQQAQVLSQVAHYERSEARQGYHSDHYARNITTISGEIRLNVPHLKEVSFEIALIKRYRQRKSGVEDALIKIYLAGISIRHVEDITEVLWNSKVSLANISELNKKAYVHIEN